MTIISRDNIVSGGCRVAFNGASFFHQGDLNNKFDISTIDIKSSLHGTLGPRLKMPRIVSNPTPEGRFGAALIAALWPYASYKPSQKLYTGTDVPYVCHGLDGEIHTIIAAAVTKMPDILFSPAKTLVGPAEITGIHGDGMAWNDADSYYTIAASGSDYADATFDPGLIPTQGYQVAFGSQAGMTAMDVLEEGWVFSTELAVDWLMTAAGVIVGRFMDLKCMLKGTPVGPTAAQILAAAPVQGYLTGKDLGAIAQQIVVTGEDGVNYLTIPKATVVGAGNVFGGQPLRVGEIGFVSSRKFTTGVMQPLFTLLGGVEILSTTLVSGTEAVAYTDTVDVSGGTSPYTFSIIAGSLPTGLNINSTTGVISGTPTTAGTYLFKVQCVGTTGGTKTAVLQIVIAAA